MIAPLDTAFKFTEESIGKCKQLSDFLRKRQEIEEEYAKSLRKLCKSVTLKPLKKQSSWFSRKAAGKAEDGEEDFHAMLLKTDLWSTFYEIVDDTSQIAKSHGIMAESLGNQILGPFEESIRHMELNRRRVMEESSSINSELHEASNILKKAKQQLEDSTNEVNSSRLALSRNEGAVSSKPREVEKSRLKYQQASDKLTVARASYRQCDDVCRALNNKVEQVDVPRISRMLSGLESARCQEVLHVLQSAMRMDRVAAEMDLQCTSSMEQKMSEIVVENVLDVLMMRAGSHSNRNNGPGNQYSITHQIATYPLKDQETPNHHHLQRPRYEISTNSHAPLQQAPSYYPTTPHDMLRTPSQEKMLMASQNSLPIQ